MLRQIRFLLPGLLSAGLLSLCFPSGNLWWLAWIALAPWLFASSRVSGPWVFWAGYLPGFLFFFVTLFWIHHVTFLGLVLMSAYLALYWGLFSMSISLTASWPFLRRLFFLPALWVLLEYIRAHFLTGFGWAALAHTQSRNILCLQIADLTGSYGVSFVLLAFNLVTSECISLRGMLNRDVRRGVWVVVLGVLVVLSYGAWRLKSVEALKTVRVALIQANVSLADYWDPALKAYGVNKHLLLSQKAMHFKPDLIVWPETAFPQFIWEEDALLDKVRLFTQKAHVRLLLGAVTRENGHYFNSAILLNEYGFMEGQYDKQHLVVFGEYIPYRHEFPWLSRLVPIDDFTPGMMQMLFQTKAGVKFSTLICFEDTIPSLARAAALGGAQFVVNMTNDAWFGASRQGRMHLDNAVYRAVENRISLVRATNTGVSAAILPTGDVAGLLKDAAGAMMRVAGVSVVDVPLAADAGAVYRKYGDIFALLCFAGILRMLITFILIRGTKDDRSYACV